MPSIFLDYAVPTKHVAHTLHDTNVLPATTIGISCVVSTAGVLVTQMHADAASVLMDLGVGTWFIAGNFKYVKSTSTTAVLTNTKVIVYIADPTSLNY